MVRTYKILHRKWRLHKALYWGLIPELAGTIAALVLFGISQPDAYRTLFWRIGFNNQLNSNPNMILYAYANHRPLPNIPFVWSQSLTNFCVAISILSLFVLLAKMIASIMKVFYPIVGLLTSFGLMVLYVVGVYGQAGPDYADKRYPSSVAWYIRMSCSIAEPYGAVKDCYMAKGAFAVTVVMMFIYLCNTALAAWAMFPNPLNDIRDDDDEEEADNDKQWEMQPPATPRTMPFTPRTQAFYTLDRKLPLRTG
ncbi:hypothetical protein B0T24DRAFT_15722 [Lasiosphaeria ovina]|uniref:Uncharacterized protein n=1 Tax=Lasiosphaeria ovina TaxID=92902 RepID=A0AAE0NJ78_9PEZI|nr:hypothetical protein B0T24DRAFT_15722 [Lasiosphaeria ovina]